jgi:CRISPR-associated endonuclease Cas1
MNAKTLERIIGFRSYRGIEVMKEIISWKIFYQFSIVRKEIKKFNIIEERLENTNRKEDIFIIEAIAAKEYWKSYKEYISKKYKWNGRLPKNVDPVNKLLDIGYHYLTGVVSKTFEAIELPYELGLLHKAQSRKAKPLVYDFMEWLRPVVVDRSVLIFLGKKKLRVEKLTHRDIGLFINLLKKQLTRTYYHKNLGYCITLEYWIRLNSLSLLYAINHKKYPSWKFPSLRHESRCKNKNSLTMRVVGNSKE